MINREGAAERITRALRRQRVVVLVGPRQCGKTTLARQPTLRVRWAEQIHGAEMSRLHDRCLMLRRLQPWHENLAKRQVKAPKVYVRDSGLLHELLGIRTDRDLWSHPKSGASWEDYALEEALKARQPDQACASR